MAAYVAIALYMARKLLAKVMRPVCGGIPGIFREGPTRLAVEIGERKYLVVAMCDSRVTLSQMNGFAREIAPYLCISAEELVVYPHAIWKALMSEKHVTMTLMDAQSKFDPGSTICEAYRKGLELSRMNEYRGIQVT